MDRAAGGEQHGLSDQPGLEHVHESTLNDAYPSAPISTPTLTANQDQQDLPFRGTKRARSTTPPLLSPAIADTSNHYQGASHTYPDDTFADAYDFVREPDAFAGNELDVGVEREGSEVLGMGESELRQEVFRLREQVRMFQEGGGGGENAGGLAGGSEQDVEGVYDTHDGLDVRAAENDHAGTEQDREAGSHTGADRDRDGDMQDAAQTLGQIATIALEHSAMYGPTLGGCGGDQHHLDGEMLLDGHEGVSNSEGQADVVMDSNMQNYPAGSTSQHLLQPDYNNETDPFATDDMNQPAPKTTSHSPHRHQRDRSGGISGLPEEGQTSSTYLQHESLESNDIDQRQHSQHNTQLEDGPHTRSLDDQDPSLEEMGLTLAHAADHEMHLAGIGAEMGLNFNLGLNMGGPSSAHGTSEYPFGLSIDALGAVAAPDEPPKKRRRTAKRSAFDIDENGKGPLPVPRAEVPVSFQTGKRLIIRDRTDALARAVRALMREEWGRLEVDPLPGPKEGGPDWLKGPRHAENIAYQDRIARTLLETIENGTCKLSVPEHQQDFPVVQLAAQTSFLNYAKRYSYQVSDDAKKKQLKIAKRGRRWARKDLKQRKRARAAATMDDVPAHLLKIDYMSSEDSSEGEDSGYPEGLWDEYAAGTGRVNEEEKVLEIKTPRWRSAELQAIFDRVDEVATLHVDALKGKGHMAPPMRRFKMAELREKRPPMDATETWMYVDGVVPPSEARGKPIPAYKMPKVPKQRAVREPKEPRPPKVPKVPKAPKEPKTPRVPRKRKAKQDVIEDVSAPAGSPEPQLLEGPADVDMEEMVTLDDSLSVFVEPTAPSQSAAAEGNTQQSEGPVHDTRETDLPESEPYLQAS